MRLTKMKALVIDDNELVRSNVAEVLRVEGWEVSEAESAARAFEMLAGDDGWQLVFCDVKLSDSVEAEGYAVLHRFVEEQPDAQIVLMTGHGSAAGALDAVSSGAYDYLMKPFENEDVLRIAQDVRRSIEKRERPGTTGELPPEPVYTSDIDLVGASSAFVGVMKLVGRVAATSLPVLVTGESGTGKEVVARAIHCRSARANANFVAVNCGAVPSELIESELFGHVRGAFTGAERDRLGLLQEADGGTILLDEITETTPAFQVKLLRALQEGEIRRVGSNHTIRVDVRVIAATNRDVESEVREGRFRQDLFYRLNAVTLHLPPLRERREDIMPLARHFAARAAPTASNPISFSRDAVRMLVSYDWPGNIRELENAVIRAVALCDRLVRPEDLPERVRVAVAAHEAANTPALEAESNAAPPDATAATTGDDECLISLSELEARHIARVLAHTGGNKQAAARLLGIDRTTLQRMIKRHGLHANGARDASNGGNGPAQATEAQPL
ncbi:MAG: two-component system, NtrC family, response regulator AtoC [Acidobacteriota bacterium]|jgi:DNA-binding NtrC family response regulator|nr:two-component system, NtrC family, response regulator AtoC [Acidobacteriota bacterium]